MAQARDQSQQGDDWYEDFLEKYDYQIPKPGQLLEGTIIQIEEEGALVDVGQKRDALVPSRDLSQISPEVLKQFKPGDTVFVYVLNRPAGGKELYVSLSKGIEHESWENAEAYLENGLPLELQIIGHNRGGLIVEFETLRGFLPYSQVPGLRGIKSPRLADKIKREMINTNLDMKVIEVVRERNRLIFSATAAEAEKRKQRLQELEKGDIILGEVVNIVDFGIFVDLGGIDGLVHLSELEWKRIKHPSEIIEIGDKINVKVLDVDIDRQRVSLSRKALLPGPWEIPEELPEKGICLEGRVVKVVNFGAFVELPIGIEGLVHTSQLGYAHLENPKNAVKRGETVLVRVLEVDLSRRRISLSMRQVPREKQISWAIEHLDDEMLISSKKDESVGVVEKQVKSDTMDVEEQEILVSDLTEVDDVAGVSNDEASDDTAASSTESEERTDDEDVDGDILEESSPDVIIADQKNTDTPNNKSSEVEKISNEDKPSTGDGEEAVEDNSIT